MNSPFFTAKKRHSKNKLVDSWMKFFVFTCRTCKKREIKREEKMYTMANLLTHFVCMVNPKYIPIHTYVHKLKFLLYTA